MSILLLILLITIVYPIVAFIILKSTDNNPRSRKVILSFIFGVAVIGVVCYFKNISTVIPLLDMLVFSQILLALYIVLWGLFLYATKVLGCLSLLLVFAIVALLGLSSLLRAEFDQDRYNRLSDDVLFSDTYEPSSFNKRISVYKIYLSFFLVKIHEQKYNSEEIPDTEALVTVDYQAEDNVIYLSSPNYSTDVWSDTIYLNKK